MILLISKVQNIPTYRHNLGLKNRAHGKQLLMAEGFFNDLGSNNLSEKCSQIE